MGFWAFAAGGPWNWEQQAEEQVLELCQAAPLTALVQVLIPGRGGHAV